MRCGVSRRTRTIGSGKPYDRATGRLTDWECGDLDERIFRRLFERLARRKMRLFCSDSHVVQT
jgi:IS1 family transposase